MTTQVLTQNGVIEGERVKPFVASAECTGPFWLDIVPPNEDDVRWLGQVFGFHPLTLEDLLGLNNRPKLEEYGDYIFMVARELIVAQASPVERQQGKRTSQTTLVSQELQAAELHIYLSERYLVTVRDERQCAVDSVWRRVTTKGVVALGPQAGANEAGTPPATLLQPPSDRHVAAANGDAPTSVSRTSDNDSDLMPPIEAEVDDSADGSDSRGAVSAATSSVRSGEANDYVAAPQVGGNFTPHQGAKRLPATATLARAAQPASNGQPAHHSSKVNPYQPQLSAADPFFHGLDFLLYSVLDDVVDSYFAALETVEDEIDKLQDVVVDRPTRGILDNIFTLKGNLMVLRKQTTPMREAVNNLITHSYSFIHKENLIYFRDVYGLLVAVYEIVDTERDNAISILDAYLSSVNNNLNVVMKRLTGISGLFLPITAITGFAGMNLVTLPNAQPWYNALIYCLLICVPLAAFYLFKRNDWL